MTTTNILKFTTALIIATILIVGVGAVDVGAQSTQETNNGSGGVGIIDILTIVTIIITAGISAWYSNKSLKIYTETHKGAHSEHKETHEQHKGEHEEHNNRHDKETILKTMLNRVGATNSPLQLNDKGNEILKNSGVEEYLEQHKTELYKEFEGINEAWKINKKALDVVVHKMYDKEFEPFEKWAFEDGCDYNDILAVMVIQLRNMVLNKKGIQIKKPKPKQSKVEQ